MKPERNRRDLRERAVRQSAITFEAYWIWAMSQAHWHIVAGRLRQARQMINTARELRQFCKHLPA